jgi:hypothetical protein
MLGEHPMDRDLWRVYQSNIKYPAIGGRKRAKAPLRQPTRSHYETNSPDHCPAPRAGRHA